MDKSLHKMDRFQEKPSPQRHSSLHNEDLRQIRATNVAIQILLQEREQRLRERVTSVEERRYRRFSLMELSLNFSQLVTDLFRYDAMPSRRHLVYSAVPANEQTRFATSEERRKSEAQAKGL